MLPEGKFPCLSGSSPSFLGWSTGLFLTGLCIYNPILLLASSHWAPTSPVHQTPWKSLNIFTSFVHVSSCTLLPSACNASPGLCLNNSYSFFKTHCRGHFSSKPCLISCQVETTCFSQMVPRSLVYHHTYHLVMQSLVY